MWFVYIALCCCVALAAGWKKEMENPNLIGGDMILSPDQLNVLRGGKSKFGSRKGYRWPNGVVPYAISNNLGSQARRAITAAINDYHKYTCLKWVPVKRGQNAYVNFYHGGSCSATVGYHGNRNDLSLGNGCHDKGTAIHEMGHTIGLYHEQNRPDRDKYIRVHRNNVLNGLYYNFQKEYDVDSLGTPYDLRSIMHYSSTAFTKDFRYKTITTVDPSKQRLIDHGDRIFDFSPIDIQQINLMYNCGNVPPPAKTTMAPPPPGGCDNKDSYCDNWAAKGWCTDNKERQYMKDNCCKACQGASCLDRHASCPEWKKRGECYNNPDYMLRVCQVSCSQCS